ncbi:S-adenosylmethionine-dependent methyltransferase Rv2258c-like [Lytechinus pictus]|uniref:S-adenosylmethionine-dependent methyltransferase Rv2258c-like n=1 Tax=Lytechinus pictus TaxID=7653 RepID=UPI0030BA0548
MAVQQEPEESLDQFSYRLGQIVENGLTSLSIAFGVKSGLFDVLVENHHTPMTSQELADAASMKERYVREWLGAMAGARIVLLDPATQRFHIPGQILDAFKKWTPQNKILLSTKSIPFLSEVFNDMLEVVKKEGPIGLPFSKAETFTEYECDSSEWFYKTQLLQVFIPSIPPLQTKLSGGIKMLDVGCGRGVATRILAGQFPRSQFVGIDFGEDNVKIAREFAKNENLTNVEYHNLDAAKLPEEWTCTFDYVFFFNVLHDLARPDLVLKEVKRVMASEALMSALEVIASSDMVDNIKSPGCSKMYTYSLFHCLPVSCNTPGSLGLGTAWGKEAATEFLKEHGFKIESVTQTSRQQFLCSVSPE